MILWSRDLETPGVTHLRLLPRTVVAHRRFSPLVQPARVLSRWLLDPQARATAVAEFEAAIARKTGARHVIATSSARVGLQALLKSLPLPPGADAWLPVNTFDGLLPGIADCGFRARFVDAGADHNVPLAGLERAMGRDPRPAVVIATHMFGLPCAVQDVVAWCGSRGIPVIEDCAHAFDVDVGGATAGLVGIAGILSFQARKAINTMAGGAVITQDDALASRVRALVDGAAGRRAHALLQLAAYELERRVFFGPRGYAWTHYVFSHASALGRARSAYGSVNRFNRHGAAGLSALQALLGRAQVDAYEDRRRRLERMWGLYDAALDGRPGVQPPVGRPGRGHGRYMYVVRTADPSRLSERLWAEGIGSVGGPSLVPCLDPAGYPAFPGAQALMQSSLQIPFAAGMTDREFERVAAALRTCAALAT